VRDGLKVSGGKSEAFNGTKYGKGIYCSPNPSYAPRFSKEKQLDARSADEEYRIMFMCRVRPGSWREETDDVWVVEKPSNIRPFAILLSRAGKLVPV
jgi:hypothetical protein